MPTDSEIVEGVWMKNMSDLVACCHAKRLVNVSYIVFYELNANSGKCVRLHTENVKVCICLRYWVA